MSQLRQVRPVRFHCNGRAGTPAGLPGVGVIGQEIEIFPEMIRRIPGAVVGEPIWRTFVSMTGPPSPTFWSMP